MGYVSGTVYLDDVPVEHGIVQFTSNNHGYPPQTTKIIKGRYEIKTFAGVNRTAVEVSVFAEEVGRYGQPIKKVLVSMGSNYPVTPLTLEVKDGGSHVFDIRLRKQLPGGG
jgi:hypothetical protein